MPPSLAIVSLLCALSVESDQIAEAARSLASGEPSRTSVQSGPIAPVLAIKAWKDLVTTPAVVDIQRSGHRLHVFGVQFRKLVYEVQDAFQLACQVINRQIRDVQSR